MNVLSNHLLLALLLLLPTIAPAQKVVLVIIDGARYSETLGDPDHTYIPKMWQLAQEGAYVDPFYNDHITYTSVAIPAIWCGAWTETVDTFYNGGNTQYTLKPSIFEYFLKQSNLPREKCLYSLKFVNSLWLQSFHPEYGPAYWPYTISSGTSDNQVLQNTLAHIAQHHPPFMLVYLANTDSAGHDGNWTEYVNTLKEADRVVGELWNALQADDFYKDQTTMLITNDHGRHDEAHGGFQHHGDDCPGCQQIMFLAIGPDIKKGYVTTQYHSIPDAAVTAASILGIDMEYADGEVIEEIFKTTSLEEISPAVDWAVSPSLIDINALADATPSLSVFDLSGKKIRDVALEAKQGGWQSYGRWSRGLTTGIYLVRMILDDTIQSQKVLIP